MAWGGEGRGGGVLVRGGGRGLAGSADYDQSVLTLSLLGWIKGAEKIIIS